MLFEMFNSVGPVASIRVCRDTLTRRSLGYAYVNFHSVVDAERALDTLNNHLVNGKPCRIMWSQRDPSIRKTGIGNIFIKNLSPAIGHKELYDTFSAFGNILSCKVAMDEQGRSKGYGFVHFENQKSAEQAIQMVNMMEMDSRTVYVGDFIPRKVRTLQLENSWTNVYVKDLGPEVDTDKLQEVFGQFGQVTSAVVMNKDSKSLGFGFINFEKHEDALNAVETMHNSKIGDKVVHCCRAQKKPEREAKLRKEWEQMKLNKYQGINLYIKNIEDEIDEERLRKEFSAFGTIKSCKIMVDEKTGATKGFGFVCFSAPEESQRAITEMNSRILQGCAKPLYVALHEPKEIRRQKLAQRHHALKGMRSGNVPQGPPAMYGPQGQPVYYPGTNSNMQGFVYPPQQMVPSLGRGWQGPPPYPHVPYPSNIHGMLPGGRTGGRGGRGAGRGNRVGGRRNNQPVLMPVESVVNVNVNPNDLSLQQLQQFPFENQKLLLGERLYQLIAASHPVQAGKITGMFLDSGWGIEELYSLLGDEVKLTEKIDDALGVLERAGVDEATETETPAPAEETTSQ
jgi:polyadenylate-binding protein